MKYHNPESDSESNRFLDVVNATEREENVSLKLKKLSSPFFALFSLFASPPPPNT
jgi:hypothetical protein